MEAWEKKLLDRVRQRGFATVGEFVSARPGVPYPELADELGPDILGVQVVDAQLREARDRGQLRSAAADSLVRCIRQQLPQGWGKTASMDAGVTNDFMNITAWSYWSTLFKGVEPGGDVPDAVWEQLRERAPLGWLPRDADDSVVRAVIDAAWPTN